MKLTLILIESIFIIFSIIASSDGGEPIFAVTKPDIEVPPKTEMFRDIIPPAPQPKVSPKAKVGNYPPAYCADRFGRPGDTTVQHLVEHGENRAFAESLSPEERNRLHGKHHMPRVQAYVAPKQSVGGCANGQCGRPQTFFRRHR